VELRYRVSVSGNGLRQATIEISGQTKGQTTYTVTVSGKIQDVFGQKAGRGCPPDLQDQAKPNRSLIGPGSNFLTLDPAASKAIFSVYAINYTKT